METMNTFIVYNDRDLGILLRMLYAEGIDIARVRTVFGSRNNIWFAVGVNVDDARHKALYERYMILKG